MHKRDQFSQSWCCSAADLVLLAWRTQRWLSTLSSFCRRQSLVAESWPPSRDEMQDCGCVTHHETLVLAPSVADNNHTHHTRVLLQDDTTPHRYYYKTTITINRLMSRDVMQECECAICNEAAVPTPSVADNNHTRTPLQNDTTTRWHYHTTTTPISWQPSWDEMQGWEYAAHNETLVLALSVANNNHICILLYVILLRTAADSPVFFQHHQVGLH